MTLSASLPLDQAFYETRRSYRFVQAWLAVLAVLVFAMVVVGGATRLTGSGLSITEWRPVTGALPPLNVQAWEDLFAKYRETPQYSLINQGMTLAEFKTIYAWEWTHRQLGRLIGLVYAAGLALILVKRLADRRIAMMLVGLGGLLGLQGLVGWIMVASGLQPGMTAVVPLKLALHLTFAAFFFAGVVGLWSCLALARTRDAPDSRPALPEASFFQAIALVVATFTQIALGGLVAGSKAGLTFNTWPLMDGAFFPAKNVLFPMTPAWENLVGNPALIQLDHRLGAYVLLALVVWHGLGLFRLKQSTWAVHSGYGLLIAVMVQAALGVMTLLLQVPLWAGLMHQAAAFLVLALAVFHLACFRQQSTRRLKIA